MALNLQSIRQHKNSRMSAMLRALLLFVLGISVADATIITIDANNYSVGTDLSHIDPNVTLSSLVQQRGDAIYAPTRSPVLARGGFGPTGNFMGPVYAGMHEYERCFHSGSRFSCEQGFAVLELSFAGPVSFVNLEGYFGVDGPWMIAYDALGNIVGRCRESFPIQPCSTRVARPGFDHVSVSLASDHGNISRVVYGSWSSEGYAALIRYSVPEPGTLALLSVGLLGVFARRRRSS